MYANKFQGLKKEKSDTGKKIQNILFVCTWGEVPSLILNTLKKYKFFFGFICHIIRKFTIMLLFKGSKFWSAKEFLSWIILSENQINWHFVLAGKKVKKKSFWHWNKKVTHVFLSIVTW